MKFESGPILVYSTTSSISHTLVVFWQQQQQHSQRHECTPPIHACTQTVDQSSSESPLSPSYPQIIRPWVVGHRGAIYEELENTLAGFQYCLDIGVDAVELDVFRLQDGELVVFHGGEAIPGDLTDYCYLPTTTTTTTTTDVSTTQQQRMSIMDLTKSQLEELRFHIHHPEFACPPDKIRSAKIPTLRQVLELYRTPPPSSSSSLSSGVIIKIELKGPDVVEPVLALVQELQMQHQCHYASFHHDQIRHIRDLHPEVQQQQQQQSNDDDGNSSSSSSPTYVYPTGALFADTIPEDYIAQAQRAGASEVHLKYDTCTVQRVREIHNAGMRSMAWFRGPVGMHEDCHTKYTDVTEEDEYMYRIVAMTGVQQICCNKPNLLIQMLQQQQHDVDDDDDDDLPPS